MTKNKKYHFFKFLHFWRFCIVISTFFYKNAKIGKLKSLQILLYLQKYLSYKDVQYLILKLLTNRFDL